MPSSDKRNAGAKRPTLRPVAREHTSQLRDDIDRGRTGDKVPASDPSAAPLGTDDEAGGTPADSTRTRLAARQRVTGEQPRRPGLAEGPRRRASVGVAIAAAVLLVLALLAFWILGG